MQQLQLPGSVPDCHRRTTRRCATVSHMSKTGELRPAAREALSRLATASDRASPTVFAGRESEFALLNDAVAGVQRGESGHTVVVQGVPRRRD